MLTIFWLLLAAWAMRATLIVHTSMIQNDTVVILYVYEYIDHIDFMAQLFLIKAQLNPLETLVLRYFESQNTTCKRWMGSSGPEVLKYGYTQTLYLKFIFRKLFTN